MEMFSRLTSDATESLNLAIQGTVQHLERSGLSPALPSNTLSSMTLLLSVIKTPSSNPLLVFLKSFTPT